MSTTSLTPSYYLVHATPAGERYAFPRPKAELPRTFVDGKTEWFARGSDGTESPARHVEGAGNPYSSDEQVRPNWLIADRVPVEFVARWKQDNPEKGPWVKRDAPRGDDPETVAHWEASPPLPTEAALTHRRQEGHDRDACLTCGMFWSTYTLSKLPPVPHEQVFDVSDWAPMTGEPDPDTSRTWTVSDLSHLAVYGPHTAHLWPGVMGGFRDAVVAALKAHPARTGEVYDHDRKGEVSVFGSVKWDRPRPRERHSGERGRGPFFERVAVTWHHAEVVPFGLAASTKADALAGWDAAVAKWVDRFMPPVDGPITACSHCAGKGYNVGGAS